MTGTNIPSLTRWYEDTAASGVRWRRFYVGVIGQESFSQGVAANVHSDGHWSVFLPAHMTQRMEGTARGTGNCRGSAMQAATQALEKIWRLRSWMDK